MNEVLKKFGRYFLLDRLAQGGMAEIYRARLTASEGEGRVMVIKRIQSVYGANEEFLQMFKSEIKVTMGLNHPNIVQLYDFGEEEGQPYIAMEWVDGRNLRQFISRLTQLKKTVPIELAIFIMEQVASALHYAHSFKNKISGTPLGIVHRDISPQNILISFDGNIKVIDFGIAKVASNSESTRTGIIKGKPSYLSPEQISGEFLDGRSDIFALGAVFWELLTGKKLFSGESDLAVLKLIESCDTYIKAPSTLNQQIPQELDSIILKSLEKNIENRYQNAEELQRALHKLLQKVKPEFNSSDLSSYAQDLFIRDILEDKIKVQTLNDQVEDILSHNITNVQVEDYYPNRTTPEKSEKSEGMTSTWSREVIIHRNEEIAIKTRSSFPQAVSNPNTSNLTDDLINAEKSLNLESSNPSPQKIESLKPEKNRQWVALFAGISIVLLIALLILLPKNHSWFNNQEKPSISAHDHPTNKLQTSKRSLAQTAPSKKWQAPVMIRNFYRRAFKVIKKLQN